MDPKNSCGTILTFRKLILFNAHSYENLPQSAYGVLCRQVFFRTGKKMFKVKNEKISLAS